MEYVWFEDCRVFTKDMRLLVAVDGHTVTSATELVSALPKGDGSHEVDLKVVREKKDLTLKAMLN